MGQHISIEKVAQIKRSVLDGYSISEIADRFNLPYKTIWSISREKTYAQVKPEPAMPEVPTFRDLPPETSKTSYVPPSKSPNPRTRSTPCRFYRAEDELDMERGIFRGTVLV